MLNVITRRIRLAPLAVPFGGSYALAASLAIAACHDPPQPTHAAPPRSASVAATPPTLAAAGSPAQVEVPLPSAINRGMCPSQPLLDDLEDGDAIIRAAERREGRWSTFTDKIGSVVEPASDQEFRVGSPGSDGSKHAVRVHGKTAPHGNVYAGVGFWLTAEKLPYDAGCCKGIAFKAKRAKGSLDSVRLKVGDTNTLPEGRVCKNCYNDFGVDLGFGEDWKQYRISFDNMRQSPGWGDSYPSISQDRLLQIQWQVNHPNFDFDFWIDDVMFWDCAPMP